MDLNLLIAVFFAIILIIFALEYDDGFMLFVLGFMSFGIVLNIDTLFEVTETSYLGFGNLLQLIYIFIGIFCFAKIIMSARNDGLISFTRGRNARK